ncbi:MAG: metal-dependent hydrolase [Niabella sp.]
MQLTYLGQSGILVIVNGKKLLFDPFITGNPLAKDIDPSKIEADYILVSHGHGDHIADVVPVAKRTGAKVISSPEVSGWLSNQGLNNLHELNHGGPVPFDFGELRAVNAIHSSSLPDGTYGGNPLGFIITSANGNFYFAGDTALTLDMQLIPLFTALNFAVLPIGGNYTMGVNDAVIASDFIKCNTIVGVHYNTFDIIKIDTDAAVSAFTKNGKTLLLPKAGETITV